MIGEILNASENVDNQESFGFTGSYFRIAPTNIDNCTKYKFLNTQQENLRPHINIENNEKQTYERYQKILIDGKESDERYQTSKNYEEKKLKI